MKFGNESFRFGSDFVDLVAAPFLGAFVGLLFVPYFQWKQGVWGAAVQQQRYQRRALRRRARSSKQRLPWADLSTHSPSVHQWFSGGRTCFSLPLFFLLPCCACESRVSPVGGPIVQSREHRSQFTPAASSGAPCSSLCPVPVQTLPVLLLGS